MSVPRGLGWWVAFESAIDDGPKQADLARAIEVCKATGATWIAVRAGAGGANDHDLSAESVEAYKAAGLGVYVWIFNYPGTTAGELAGFKRWKAAGVDGAIFNAEFEYLPASDDQARKLVRAVRDLGYDFVAHAPPDYAGAAGQGPLDALDEECDAIMPQTYAFEHDDRGHLFHIARVLDRYRVRGYGTENVWPILCSYRPKVRGYDANEHAIPIPRLPNQPALIAADVVAGLDACATAKVPAPSIYTIDALHFIYPDVGAAVLEAVTEWARGTTEVLPTQLDSPAVPHRYVEQAEAAIADTDPMELKP